MKLLKPFNQLGKDDATIAGGKGASLGEMTQAGIPVPPGFVILAEAFERFIIETGLTAEIDAILGKVDHREMHTVEHASESIQGLVLNVEMPADLRDEIEKSFKDLNTEFVAVRSSATAEDGVEAAWAGQLDTYLNTTHETLLEKVRECWASLFTPRAIFYRFEKGMNLQKISVAVVVQKMVNSDTAGIAFSVHPVTEDRNQMIIEAGFGLGEAVVSGQVTPDSYVVTKAPLTIMDKNISEQSQGLYRKPGGGNEWKGLQKEKGSSQVLTDEQILSLSEILITIENHYGFPVDMEWAMEDGELYIVQSRPITTLSKPGVQNIERWELSIQRNFPPFAISTSTHAEWKGFTLGPLVWKRGREIAIRMDDEQMQCFMNPHEYYISNIETILRSIHLEFEEALDTYNARIYEGVRVSPGTTKDELRVLNEIHQLMYVLMLIGYDIAGDIKNLLEKELDLTPELEDYLSITVGETAVERERQALREAREVKDTVRSLANEFGYLHQDYLGKPWTEIDYVDALKQPIMNVPVNETFNVQSYSPYQQWLITLFKKNLYLYEEGRNAMVRCAWAMKETIHALGEDPEKLLYMTLDEVTAYANGLQESISNELYEQRKEAYGVYFEGDTFLEVTGKKDVDAIIGKQNIAHFLEKKEFGQITELKGRVAFKGKARGKVRLVFNQKDADLVEEGDIFVSPMTQVEFLSGLRKCGAIVTDEGGIVCHAAIVAREFSKPCILAARDATKILKNGDEVEVDADKGIVRIISKKRVYQYSKAYTRENCLIAIQIWEEHQCHRLKEKFGIAVPLSIFDAHEGVARVYYREDIDEAWSLIVTSKAQEDRNFIPELMTWYGEQLDTLEAIWRKGKLSSAKELEDLFDLASWAWVGLSISYFLPGMEGMRKEEQELGMQLRERSADFLELTDHVIQDTLRDLYPTLGDLVKYIRIEEVKSGDIPAVETLRDREKHYIYYDFKLYTNTELKNLLKEHAYSIEEERIPSNVSDIHGQIAMAGIAKGKVRILHRKADISLLQEGEILVTAMTTPDYLPAMYKAAAFITDEGGITCHAAIVAREMGKPCVIGTKIATKVLKDGDYVEIDANVGVVRKIETITFKKSYSRDTTLFMQELWAKGLIELPATKFGWKNPYLPLVAHYVNDGVVEIWEHQEAIDWLLDRLLQENMKGPYFLDGILEEYKDLLGKLRYFHTKESLSSKEAEEYADLIYGAAFCMTLFFYTGSDERSPHDALEISVKARETEDFFAGNDVFVRKILVNAAQISEELAGVVLTEELSTIPAANILQNRLKNYLLIDGVERWTDSLKAFLANFPEYDFVETEVVATTELHGQSAYNGVIRGTVRIVRKQSDMARVVEGDILVSPMTTPDFLPAMIRAAAFVTDEGGITCHAAIVAREMGKPCVIGTKIGTQVLNDGDLVEVNADTGVVKKIQL
ncbi:hypothetical protein BH11PAT2_BH11PAT2_01230 [soil metagenome]